MKISRHWIQKYFAEELPRTEELADALTFHAFEIEGVEKGARDEVLDVKITANRGHDCLSHRGIAKELSAILDVELASDPCKEVPDLSRTSDIVDISIQNPGLCSRYIAGHIRAVHVGPSPKWLQDRLEAIGQRSINNIVDATNFVMFNIGQPLHAFDLARLTKKGGNYALGVRNARPGERIEALDGVTYTLQSPMLLVVDEHSDEPIGIAGIKGGMTTGITLDTKDVVIESAHFNAVSVRRTAQNLKLRTDASARFEQDISPELAAYGIRAAVELIESLAGGTFQGYADVYPVPQKNKQVSVALRKIQEVLGKEFDERVVDDVFARLGFLFEKNDGIYTVTTPFERLDLTLEEDLIEEVGRIHGYDHVPSVSLPPFPKIPAINANFYWTEKIREFLVSRGFFEVYTSAFAERGERIVLNKVDGTKPYLRSNLADGLNEALEKNIRNKELLGLTQAKFFEIGMVWRNGGEILSLGLAVESLKKEKDAREFLIELLEFLGAPQGNLPPEKASAVDVPLPNLIEALPLPTEYERLPLSAALRYKAFSKYPFIIRDVAMWVPDDGDAITKILTVFGQGGETLRNVTLFDQFKKDGRISYAFRLVFQSYERTLEEKEVNAIMETLYVALRAQGFEIR